MMEGCSLLRCETMHYGKSVLLFQRSCIASEMTVNSTRLDSVMSQKTELFKPDVCVVNAYMLLIKPCIAMG